ncbi:phosphonate C-P lyase system protein PhnG [Roseivivax jejudonensis]|nr:phosphonate C-P lyase system protein PhnG [Roseivivax jejudonensis]
MQQADRTAPETGPDMEGAARRHWMGLLARAAPKTLAERLATFDHALPAFAWLRRPETGSVMVRGRAGGTGAPFNLGEMTVTRCVLRLEDGTVGHAYVQGRDERHAERAALVDAMMQTSQAESLRAEVLDPLTEAEAHARAERAEKAAATRVEFFTVARGED